MQLMADPDFRDHDPRVHGFITRVAPDWHRNVGQGHLTQAEIDAELAARPAGWDRPVSGAPGAALDPELDALREDHTGAPLPNMRQMWDTRRDGEWTMSDEFLMEDLPKSQVQSILSEMEASVHNQKKGRLSKNTWRTYLSQDMWNEYFKQNILEDKLLPEKRGAPTANRSGGKDGGRPDFRKSGYGGREASIDSDRHASYFEQDRLHAMHGMRTDEEMDKLLSARSATASDARKAVVAQKEKMNQRMDMDDDGELDPRLPGAVYNRFPHESLSALQTVRDRSHIDDDYVHDDYDEREFLLQIQAEEDLRIEENILRRNGKELADMPRHWSTPNSLDVNDIADEVRQAMFALHESDPVVWNVRAVAKKFALSQNFTRSIIRMQAMMRRFDEANWLHRPNHLDALIPNPPSVTEEVLKSKYYQLDPVQKKIFNYLFPPTQLHVWRPQPTSLWRPQPHVTIASEKEVLEQKRLEARKRVAWLSHQDRRARKEARRFSRTGPIGTRGTDASVRPVRAIDASVQPPSRHPMSLVDTSFASSNQYKVAVRDVDGVLRTPSQSELKSLRSKEHDKRRRFSLQDWHTPPAMMQPHLQTVRARQHDQRRDIAQDLVFVSGHLQRDLRVTDKQRKPRLAVGISHPARALAEQHQARVDAKRAKLRRQDTRRRHAQQKGMPSVADLRASGLYDTVKLAKSELTPHRHYDTLYAVYDAPPCDLARNAGLIKGTLTKQINMAAAGTIGLPERPKRSIRRPKRMRWN